MGQIEDFGTLDDVRNDPAPLDRYLEGMPPEVRKDFEGKYIPKSEFTRMRQEDRDEVKSLRSELEQIKQTFRQPAGNGSATPSADMDPATEAFSKTLTEFGIAEEGQMADLHKALTAAQRAALRAHGQQVFQATLQQLGPFIQGFTSDYQDRKLSESRNNLEKKLGKETVEKLWPEVRRKATELLKQGKNVDPESLMRDLYPDQYEEALARSYLNRRRREKEHANRISMEGMHRTVRSTAMPMSEGGETKDQPFTGIDTDDLCRRVMQEVGM